MQNKRKYHIVIGSKAFFDSKLPEFSETLNLDGFLELVRMSDTAKQAGIPFTEHADVLVLKNNNYHGIVDSAHDRLGGLIEDLTTDSSDIYIHNPPRVLREYLDNQFQRDIISLDVAEEKHEIKRDPSLFNSKMKEISHNIIGQELAVEEISKSLWYLTTTKREKPYVIMLYGNSSLGKTELVRKIADNFFDGKCLEKHLSMFKNNNYSDYFFGDAPNRRSIGFDLLERESNLIFFDEIDKCPQHFYSAFYTLFDNILFKDTTYDVNISGLVIVLTSNFHSEDEIKEQLGLPIFYRIDKFIHFDDFDCETIYTIIKNEIESRKDEYESKLTSEMVYAAVSPLISVSGENARTIKYKVQKVIENLLFQEVISTASKEHIIVECITEE